MKIKSTNNIVEWNVSLIMRWISGLTIVFFITTIILSVMLVHIKKQIKVYNVSQSFINSMVLDIDSGGIDETGR